MRSFKQSMLAKPSAPSSSFNIYYIYTPYKQETKSVYGHLVKYKVRNSSSGQNFVHHSSDSSEADPCSVFVIRGRTHHVWCGVGL